MHRRSTDLDRQAAPSEALAAATAASSAAAINANAGTGGSRKKRRGLTRFLCSLATHIRTAAVHLALACSVYVGSCSPTSRSPDTSPPLGPHAASQARLPHSASAPHLSP